MVLIKNVNRNTTARIPVPAQPQPFWAEFGDQSLGNPDAAGLVKLTLVAKRSQEELEGFALEDEFAGYIIDNQMSEIWLTRYRA